MTIIKQKGVVSERHAKNIRAYLNDKDAVMRGTWNLVFPKSWFAEMDQTRKDFGHDKAARGGAKNTIMYHQILAFLPEECSCNGGEMTPELCMSYALEWVKKHYPNQQVAFALHEESDKNGKRYAVHMAINRSDLITGKRMHEGRGRQAAHRRAQAVRAMDAEWGLQQVTEGEQNSKIRPRMRSNERKTDVERIMTERGPETSYKNNLRRLVDRAIEKTPGVVNMETLFNQMKAWGVHLSVSHKKLYATDMDVLEAGNPKHTFRLDRMDADYTIENIQKLLTEKRAAMQNAPKAAQLQPVNERQNKPKHQEEDHQLSDKEAYVIRLDKAWDAYREHLKIFKGRPVEEVPKFKLPHIPEHLRKDPEILDATREKLVQGRSLRERYGLASALTRAPRQVGQALSEDTQRRHSQVQEPRQQAEQTRNKSH